jgi:hypothetical protein
VINILKIKTFTNVSDFYAWQRDKGGYDNIAITLIDVDQTDQTRILITVQYVEHDEQKKK